MRFELDLRADREARMLRSAAAVVVLVAGVWLFTLPFVVPRLFAVAGFVFAALWLRGAAKQRARPPARHYLELGREALVVCDGGSEQVVPWPAIASVAIDEDRLVVIVSRRDAPPLAIEPHFRGVPLHDLAQHIQTALEAYRQRGGCVPAKDG
jgi:hypothetical protein